MAMVLNSKGGGEIPWFSFCPFLKIFDKIRASNLLCRWKSSFPYIFSQKSCKNLVFLRFLAKNWFLLIFIYIFNASKFLRACWLYDITVGSWSSMVLILVSMDGGGPYPYTGGKGYQAFCIENPGRGLQQPPLQRMCYKQYLRRIRVNLQVVESCWNSPINL